MVADYIGCMIQLPLEGLVRGRGGRLTMTSERYAATDDAFKAVMDHAPNKESTKLSGLVANARARRPEVVTTAGQLPQVVATASNSLSPDIDTRKPMVVGADPARRDRTVWPDGTADAQHAEPRARRNAPLT
jgi:hypothetical protein